jgi:2-succinyl-5-enolpyruvyl-6-hydroxy-3-cyclohexene-1-carboxylate synthase
MLIVTADRPPELKDVGAPQTIDQTKMYGDRVRWFHDPGVADVAAIYSWRSLARQSIAYCLGVSPGPVHLNLPFREPLVGTAADLPTSSLIRHQMTGNLELSQANYESVASTLNTQQGLIIAGRGCGSAIDISRLASSLNWPVLADSRSGCQGMPEAVSYFDSVLRCEEFISENQPTVVLRLGESPSSKVLSQFVTKSRAAQVHVSAFASTVDADHRVSLHVSCDPTIFCREVQKFVKPNSDSGFLVKWLSANRAAGTTIEQYFGNADSNLLAPRVAQLVAQRTAFAADLPHLDEANAQAVSLGYKADASKVDKAKQTRYAASQVCSNCALFQAASGAAAGACPLFAGKQVAAKAWCTAWAKKA